MIAGIVLLSLGTHIRMMLFCLSYVLHSVTSKTKHLDKEMSFLGQFLEEKERVHRIYTLVSRSVHFLVDTEN